MAENTNIGEVGLDIVVDPKKFNRQMEKIEKSAGNAGKGVESAFNGGVNGLSKLTKIATKAASVFAKAFAVKKLVEFGKECVDLGSDLQEVQNVVDVTFPALEEKVNSFAQTAISSFGLSETMSKRFTGTFGAMAKAFGFSEQQAYDMSTALTGLAGDVASFYNITQDEAYTKLKSVFTGETESLKDLGVVMTQTALDSYALANGFGKTTAAMSEAEKVALRYKFVQEQLSAASGDFQRTSGNWANQVRVLNLQLDSIKAKLGQGLITALTPVIRVVNVLLGKLVTLADAFRSLMEGLFGDGEAGQSVAKSMVSSEQAAAGLANSTGETADNLKKASRFLAGFDKIQKMPESQTEGNAGSDIENIDFSFSGIGTVEEEVNESVSALTKTLKKFNSYLTKKFSPSIKRVWEQLKQPIQKWQASVETVLKDLEKLIESFLAFVRGPFVDGITEGFESAGEIAAGLLDTYEQIFSDIWGTAIYPLAEKLIEDWLPILDDATIKSIQIFETLFGAAKELFDKLWAEGVKPALENVIGIIEDLADCLERFWYKWAEPVFAELQKAFVKTKDVLLEVWEKTLEPIWNSFMDTVDRLWKNHLEPFISNFLDLCGELADGALKIYNEFILPLVSWLSEKLGPVFVTQFDSMMEKTENFLGAIVGTADGITTALRGVTQFLTGTFTGDWEKAWLGIKNIFKGIFDSLESLLVTPINNVIGKINKMLSGITEGINNVISKLNSIKLGDWSINLPEVTAPQIPTIPTSNESVTPKGGGSGTGRSGTGPSNGVSSKKNFAQISMLAEGGYVKKNTPQLAMIGDNRHQGEVVAPEGKLLEMAMQAVRAAGGGGITKEEMERIMNNAVLRIVAALASMGFYVDGELIATAIQTAEQAIDSRFNPVTPA